MHFGEDDNYVAKTGRWLTSDPLGFLGEDPNLYRYVANNPENATDPPGLAAEPGTPPPAHSQQDSGEEPSGPLSPKEQQRFRHLLTKPRLTEPEKHEMEQFRDRLIKLLHSINQNTFKPEDLAPLKMLVEAWPRGQELRKVMSQEIDVGIKHLKSITQTQYDRYKAARKYCKTTVDIEDLKLTFGSQIREQLELQYLLEQIQQQLQKSRGPTRTRRPNG
jgi:hypothetical protein